MRAIDGPSRRVLNCGRMLRRPARNSRSYVGSIETPCESTPRRSVSSIIAAVVSACASLMPHARSTLTSWLRMRSAGTRTLHGRAGRAGRLQEIDADRRVGLEWAPETELLADLTQGRQHLGAEQSDARLGVLAGHEAVGGPEPDDRRPRLFQQPAQLGDDRLRRAGDDLLV